LLADTAFLRCRHADHPIDHGRTPPGPLSGSRLGAVRGERRAFEPEASTIAARFTTRMQRECMPARFTAEVARCNWAHGSTAWGGPVAVCITMSTRPSHGKAPLNPS
jgi:hypothetical protein